MKKKLLKGLSVLAAAGLFAACQNEEVKQSEEDTHESHQHTEETGNTETAPAVIEGLSDHYHTGDTVELTAAADIETDGHWHWYTSEDQENWELIEGEYEDALSLEAADEQYIKTVLYDDEHEPVAESDPVNIKIDDHTGDIYNGHFEDNQIEDRDISDWSGEWQSIYPYLESGELDDVFEHKSEDGDMTAEEYKEYYREGYMTNVNEINITDSGEFTFYESDEEYTGKYEYDGYEILEYEAGNRGVRFIFNKTDGDGEAPDFIQFSDHIIAPEKSSHFHLYWGDDREALLDEVVNWPTYYPADSTADSIKKDMLKH
ncbi:MULTISPECIES: ZinT family metal-binding protein [Jeotgalicoccus]|jgi:Predicted periplasmic or secreted protein|uniref:ZinT/AdcA family metal-binding protein n=1 Tax=Jeotgalicoccus nanhaiensis TaxID=568603 RepID=A0ABR9XYP1_9STAP|nr:ZinT/AdcA family metal-binding protein [Jeotgalicoccus nanhaiensis]MBF0753978.1 ZinT/AdcA family metal-binding protein [Jeotgalicoccus nanhaiensis]TFU62130.1 metal-binding protein ZinT [Jeotgalicoccus nanhaiensis]